ncbi:nucleotide-binding protein [Enterococcus faecium]|uniref:TIR domain-containing protein n=1 Tax=Enterococcus TaxID=1350 RepID=UPI0008A849DE|nr:nucleotide-binding protein [Enterococcus sp. HMSC072F02]MDB7281320.1 nucleotide-binding protein [Enterococcus faecium]MDB7283935.1 nucleotide-binding protein [Enterococcus faecium]MDB7289042.1 nucleotide-binding protein [Enterococcus faecium]MDB7294127.1 nucleotide-binding protein [Enterococcus faecium]MDB7304122.1 nucleotide-binding protein [Enterococcus faecium]
MKNFNITKIQLEAIIENILEYTGEASIRIPCEKLIEGIQNGNLSFDLFEYYCKTIASWYPENIGAIRTNDYVHNLDSHIKNISLIQEIVDDIGHNKKEYEEMLVSPRIKKENPNISENEIFIVHGHDDGLKNEVARFFEKLSLKPVILHEQANSGDTIIEKIERYSNVGFGVVLYTPCDVGNSIENQTSLNPRARQNVVFEHGYLIGKLGRKNVAALVKGDVEKPNDISGVVYINYLMGDSWKTDIAKELNAAGYKIDFNKIFQ